MSKMGRIKQDRLCELIRTAEQVVFDDRSRMIFFSDIHRGDNTWADEFAHNQSVYAHALNYYLESGFTYIEVGDGDELMKNGRIQPLRTAHAGIYQTLRAFYAQGRFYYLHGNHDIQYRMNEFASRTLHQTYNPYRDELEPLFPDITIHEGLVLVHQKTGGKILVTHGHQGEFLNDRCWQISRFLLRHFWRPLQLLGIQNPSRVSSNPEIRKNIELELMAWSESHDIPLLCGHTHCPHLPRPGRIPYFNTGSCVHPRYITGIELDRGEIKLVRWRIKPDALGALYVQREIISGPYQTAAYFQVPSAQDYRTGIDHSSPANSGKIPVVEEVLN